MFGERKHNYPEGYKEKPWCPHTKLINICASLAGVERPPEEFCTERMENAVYTRGTFDLLESADFYVEASCAKLNQILFHQLELIESHPEDISDEEIKRELKKAKDFDETKKMIDEYTAKREPFRQRQETISRWRRVIFKTCCSTPDDEKNHHFRQIGSANELSEDEVIGRVKQFMAGLAKIIGYEEGTLGQILGDVKNCHQAPKSWDFGPFYD